MFKKVQHRHFTFVSETCLLTRTNKIIQEDIKNIEIC